MANENDDWVDVPREADCEVVSESEVDGGKGKEEATLPIRGKEGTDGGKPAKNVTLPIRKRKQDSIKESDVQHIKPNEMGWITFNSSKDIEDVLLRLEYDRQEGNVRRFDKHPRCDYPRT